MRVHLRRPPNYPALLAGVSMVRNVSKRLFVDMPVAVRTEQNHWNRIVRRELAWL